MSRTHSFSDADAKVGRPSTYSFSLADQGVVGKTILVIPTIGLCEAKKFMRYEVVNAESFE